ncbi:MAG: hypothetical protein IPO83_01900 [Chitinophagaceae bacterium]|nr:hypothetical protein [Chitinophagaceae bacterium]
MDNTYSLKEAMKVIAVINGKEEICEITYGLANGKMTELIRPDKRKLMVPAKDIIKVIE